VPDMQKWEYLFVGTGAANNKVVPYTLNGKPIKNWKSNKPIYEYIQWLGEQGWELVSFTQLLTNQIYTFKRPKE